MDQETVKIIEALLEEAIVQQRAKIVRIAAELRPRLGPDDLLNPHDYPELVRDSRFNYEDGQLAGLITAQMTIRSRAREQ